MTDESAHRKRTRANREASPVSYRSGFGQRSMGNHNHAIGWSEVSEGSIVAGKRVKARGAKGPYCKHATIRKEGGRLRANSPLRKKLTPRPEMKLMAGKSVNPSSFCDGSSTVRRRITFDSQTVKSAGEPSTGNLYTRFDEGRGGLAHWLAPSSTLLPFSLPSAETPGRLSIGRGL